MVNFQPAAVQLEILDFIWMFRRFVNQPHLNDVIPSVDII